MSGGLRPAIWRNAMTDVKRLRIVTVYLFSFMAAFALSGTMFSTILPKIIQDYQLTLTQAGLFPVSQSVGNLLAMLLTALVGDRSKKSLLVGLAFAMMGLMMLGISFVPPFWALLILMGLLGLSTSTINLMVTAYTSDLYQENRSRYISLLHVCFGVGSLLGPAYPALLSQAGLAWRHSYLALGVAVFALGAGYFVYLGRCGELSRIAISECPASSQASEKRKLSGYQGMLALCAMSFLYMGGHQGAFSTWFQTFLQRKDPAVYPESFTSLCMMIYWIGMVASRILGASLPRHITARSVLLASSSLGTLLLASGLLVGQKAFWPAASAMLGLSTGVIYPLTFAISCEQFPESSARVSSIVGIFSSLGSMCFGWAIGNAAEHSLQVAMWIPVVSLAAVFFIVFSGFPKHDRGVAFDQGDRQRA